MRLEGLEQRRLHLARRGDAVERRLQRLEHRLGGGRMLLLVEPVALDQRAEPGANAQHLVGVELAARLVHEPVDREPGLEHVFVDQRELVA